MKAVALGLQTSVGTSYDQTRTTLVGRASQKTLSSKLAVGTPLVSFADVTTDAALTPLHIEVTANGRALIVNAPAAGVGTIALYNFDMNTGAWTYVGKLAYTVPNSPATTHTVRSVKAMDTGTTGWKIFVGTVGSQPQNGGLFMLNNVALADFVPVGFATLPVASAGGQKAVYFLQETGGTNNLTTLQGMDIDLVGTRVYVGNRTAATFQVYVFDWSLTITTVLAGGITADAYVSQTGALPGIAGTILLLNNFTIHTPITGPNAGFVSLFVPTSTNLHSGRVSDLTSGAVTWPTLQQVNVLDVPNTNTGITPLTAHYSDTLDRAVMQVASRFFIKPFVNNSYDLVLGTSGNTQFRTGIPVAFQELGSVALAGTMTRNGWLFTTCSTVGQIGVQAFDMRSADVYDASYVVSKVVNTPNASYHTLRFTSPVRSFARVYYRTSGFGSLSGGWTAVPLDGDMSAIVPGQQIQFKLMPRFERDGSTIPLQFYEGFLVYTSNNEVSDNWEYSHDDSSTGNPSRVTFRLKSTYSSVVPTIYFRAYDLTNTLVANHNTSANPGFFEYSTNGGVSWLPLGTVPNTVGTLLRYTFSVPPGVDVRPSVRES